MGTIAVPFDIEEGHTLPQFGLLKFLRARGHRVCCLGMPEIEGLVRRQGFEFIPLVAPKGAQHSTRIWMGSDICLGPLLRGVLDDAMSWLQPNVVMIRSQYYTEGLVIHYRYRCPVVFMISSFRKNSRERACENIVTNALMNFREGVPELLNLLSQSGVQFKSFKEIAREALRFPELMLFPEAFDLPGRESEPGVYYIGAGVDLARNEETFQWNSINPDLPLVYCALGSQNHLNAEMSCKFFRAVIDTASSHPEWQFLIAIGKSFTPQDFMPVPATVTLSKWAPQLQALARSTVMINHGGFGTIKECILMGVPMVVLPLFNARDHVMCAERIVYHGLGVSGNIDQVSVNDLGSLIEKVMSDRSFKEQVGLMREKFKQQDRLDIGAAVIEGIILGLEHGK